MIGEFAIFGVLLPPMLVSAALAAISTGLARRAMLATGAYRWVWHAALFDLAGFVVLWAAIDALISG